VGIAGFRGEEPEGVVAPVIYQVLLDQEVIVDKGVNGQQLDGGDSQRFEMLDGDRMGECLICATNLFRYVRVLFGEALNVDFVDDRFVPGRAWGLVATPFERRIGHQRLWHALIVGSVVERKIILGIFHIVAVNALIPCHLAVDRLRVRVDQHLGRVEAFTTFRLVGTVHAEAVSRPGADTRHISMPDAIGSFWKLNCPAWLIGTVLVQAEFNAGSVRGEDGKICPLAIPSGAEGS